MTLPASGQLTFEQINVELGNSSTAQANSRTMAAAANPAKVVPDSTEEWYSYTHSTIPNAPTKVGANMNFVPIATWFDNSSNETGFRIQWSINGGAYGNTQTVGANSTTASFTGSCVNGSTYKPRVQSYNTAGNSVYVTGGQTTGDSNCPF